MKILVLLLTVVSCSNLFYHPSKRQFVEPKQLKLEYQDYFFKASDNVQLHSWFFPSSSKPAKGTIILFHGNAQNLSTHFLNLVWITKSGYNLFIFDYRGYGKSEGEPNQHGIYKDALAALMKGREINQKNGNGAFIVYGQSLGGAVSLRALADFKYIDEVDLIVQDSTFSSYKEIAFDRLTTRWFLIPFSPLAFVLVSDAYASDEIFHKIKRPLLVVVGEKDEIIPAKFGEEIFKEIPSEKKWLWRLPHGRHIEIFHNKNEIYRDRFLELLKQITQK